MNFSFSFEFRWQLCCFYSSTFSVCRINWVEKRFLHIIKWNNFLERNSRASQCLSKKFKFPKVKKKYDLMSTYAVRQILACQPLTYSINFSTSHLDNIVGDWLKISLSVAMTFFQRVVLPMCYTMLLRNANHYEMKKRWTLKHKSQNCLNEINNQCILWNSNTQHWVSAYMANGDGFYIVK